VFPRLSTGDAEGLCSSLRDKFEVSVVPGRFFESPGHFRIGIGGEIESVRESLQRLALGLDAYSKSR
jgi:aspartate/methionine/tyrosine aminotransferase